MIKEKEQKVYRPKAILLKRKENILLFKK